MNPKQAWQQFMRTGSVQDYLRYRRALDPAQTASEEENIPHAQVGGRHRHSGTE